MAATRARTASAERHHGLKPDELIGLYRTMEKGQVIDASGELDGVTFKNAAELGAVLRNHPDAASCIVSKLYSSAQGRELVAVDTAPVGELTSAFQAQGHRVDQLLVELVSSEAFRFVEPVRR